MGAPAGKIDCPGIVTHIPTNMSASPELAFSNYNGRADTDPMFINYVGTMTFSFQNKPTRFTMAYEVYKSIFIQDRSRFAVISKLHQNSATDLLHFSVRVDVINSWFHTLHYNGWWDGDRFMLQTITAMTVTRDKQEFIETIAQFY
jgi:hypothetical protein